MCFACKRPSSSILWNVKCELNVNTRARILHIWIIVSSTNIQFVCHGKCNKWTWWAFVQMCYTCCFRLLFLTPDSPNITAISFKSHFHYARSTAITLWLLSIVAHFACTCCYYLYFECILVNWQIHKQQCSHFHAEQLNADYYCSLVWNETLKKYNNSGVQVRCTAVH